MPSQIPPEEPIVRLQARAIVDLETRIDELEARLAEAAEQRRAHDATIAALQERVRNDEQLLGVYQRSRAVRAATLLKRLQPGSGRGAV